MPHLSAVSSALSPCLRSCNVTWITCIEPLGPSHLVSMLHPRVWKDNFFLWLLLLSNRESYGSESEKADPQAAKRSRRIWLWLEMQWGAREMWSHRERIRAGRAVNKVEAESQSAETAKITPWFVPLFQVSAACWLHPIKWVTRESAQPTYHSIILRTCTEGLLYQPSAIPCS